MKRKPKVSFSPPSKKDLEQARQRLRYMQAENVIEDFGTARDRKVIAAVWRWLSLNGVVAWRSKKDPHVFDTVAAGAGRRRKDRGLCSGDAVVIADDAWKRAETVFGIR